ncbi:3-oxosteroid 1-dehydrogenase [Novosphingobium sp. PhB165]|uniref:FAD-binding protein n=1 Tax=Novosphingobium sp. PhB165 TaxID=2485105 RepID=UPI0010EDC034|nr:FAD-binding protein [Novosphingobium sp. PhB165]TCM15343.1 3-oxosteroid 1-dehydrogenase [Novosphingobium sp. PhB165]
MEKLPEQWDLEADVVAIGSGAGGLCAAITAQDHGFSALVLERSDQVGGVTAYSMGEVWVAGNHLGKALGVEDSPESGFRYVKGLSAGYADDVAILNQAIHAPVALRYFEETIDLRLAAIPGCPDYYYPHTNDSVAEGRLLEPVPFPAASLGEWQSRTRVSPHVPYSMTHHDIFTNGGTANMLNWDYTAMSERMGSDERCLGPGLAAYFVKGAIDRAIPLHTGVNVEKLIGDGERIVGVRAKRDGRDVYIKANRGVVIAVSSYERDPTYSRTLGNQLDPQSMVMQTIDGAHLRLAGPFGARIARVPDGTILGIHTPGEEQEGDLPLWRGALPFMGLPHTIVVNSAGKRFGNEAFYRSIAHAINAIDGNTQTHSNYPCWAIFDHQAREKYPFGGVMPGQEIPESMGVTAGSLAELADRIGVDTQGLLDTVEAFNRYSLAGGDPEFRRGAFPWSVTMCGDPNQKPNGNLGPLLQAPFYAVQLHRMAGGGIAAAGLVGDEHCRVIGWDEEPIEGLYVAGNSMARLDNGAVMQSGMTNARGITHGYLAALHAIGRPSTLLDEELARRQRLEAAE